ncbi:MAG: c-type cytochrome [Planctomycetes bacterium]|nr:c-type cytochrome [Planctomycetota bacterium]MCB9886298.1 c-type cytochrome [Planctomycetota bacterium]
MRLDMVMVKTFFGSEPFAPTVDNPSTPEKVALGKTLFHEQGLSKNGNLSCASCHDLANYGQDGKPTSPGSDGKNGTRNTPTVYNAFRQYAQFWDARAATVEEQAIMPMLNPIEHGITDEADLLAKIKAKPELVAAFGKAFPGAGDAVTAANFKLAIGAFERTLVTKSKFDKFLDGDNRAFSNEEKQGLKTFMDAGCTQCHMSRLVGGSMIQKLGVYGPYPTTDTGRMEVTKSESDKFMFKVSSLLNVEKTAPYYHDGKVATLEEAVKDMALLQLNKKLTDAEVASIVTFLKTLTGPLPAEFAK